MRRHEGEYISSMIGEGGTPKPEFFVADGLHMTPAGYKAWTQMLRPHLK